MLQLMDGPLSNLTNHHIVFYNLNTIEEQCNEYKDYRIIAQYPNCTTLEFDELKECLDYYKMTYSLDCILRMADIFHNDKKIEILFFPKVESA